MSVTPLRPAAFRPVRRLGRHPGHTVALGLAVAAAVALAALPAQAARRHRGTQPAPSAAAPAPAPAAVPAASGTTPTPIGQFGDWQAYQLGSGQKRSCFVISSPKQRKPDSLKRDPATFFVSSRPAEGVHDELSVISGLAMRDGTEASLKVGRTSYALYVKGSNAWVRDTGQDATILAAMRRSRSAVFEGTSGRGSKMVDIYSLSGLPQALAAMRKSCP